MPRILPVLGFVGSSGSGKTTLLEGVVSMLSDRGARLAVLKHAKPGFDIDSHPGKDSHRLRTRARHKCSSPPVTVGPS